METSDYVLLELLAKLGGVQGRKKLQKLCYIAKLAGAPIEDDFFFHYYGPYSSELASRVDHLVESGHLREIPHKLFRPDMVEYGYDLTRDARGFLESVRPQNVPEDFRKAMDRGINRVTALKDRHVFTLELAATLLYWRAQGDSWEEAEATTEQRKETRRDRSAFKEAQEIAKEVWQSQEQTGD